MSNNLQPLNDEQLGLLNQLTRNNSSEQLAWLSGYLWALAAKTPQNLINTSVVSGQMPTIEAPAITILSASQTGNARRIAQDLSHDIERLGYKVTHIHASDYKFKQIDKERYFIIITSTQGDGEVPEEALALHKYLFSQKAPTLNSLYFAVLGLGDSSYIHFCQAGKDFDQRLSELGANRLLERVDADTDYQVVSDNWRQHIIDQLSQHIKLNAPVLTQNPATDIVIESGLYHRDNPFRANVNINQKITARDSGKNIHHLELDLGDSGLRYKPGDSIGIWYQNNADLVEELLSYINLSPDETVTANGQPLKLKQALIEKYELTQNTSNIVEQYARLTSNQSLLSLIKDPSALRDFSQQTPIVDMLRRYPAKLNATDVIHLLRPLTPRLYSISSAQDEVGDEVHLTVCKVEYMIDDNARFGGCSGFLAEQIAEQNQVSIFIESNDSFRLPADNTVPIIMIGAGTGIAPFRAFMQQRASESASGKNWLIFGNPHFVSDFLYQVEWQRYSKDNLLTRIDLAWSRDQPHKIYVQDKLREQAAKVWQWLQQGAHIYVCGDASTMAKAVDQVLLHIIMQQGSFNEDQASDYIDELRINKRYQRDIY